MSEQVRFRSRDELTIEGLIDGADSPKAVLVLCHPHPQMGGTMRAPLLTAVVEEMVGRDWGVVRFNFRGIGESEGTSSTGEAEEADALGAVDLARARFPGIPVALGGWSFGAAVALHVARRIDDLLACVAIAPAIDPKPGVTRGAPEASDYETEVPTLIVVGANDEQVSPTSCSGWAGETGARLVEMPAANHFFWARYEPLAAVVGDFLDECLREVT